LNFPKPLRNKPGLIVITNLKRLELKVVVTSNNARQKITAA
jgi:hypothetical protein